MLVSATFLICATFEGASCMLNSVGISSSGLAYFILFNMFLVLAVFPPLTQLRLGSKNRCGSWGNAFLNRVCIRQATFWVGSSFQAPLSKTILAEPIPPLSSSSVVAPMVVSFLSSGTGSQRVVTFATHRLQSPSKTSDYSN